MQHHEIEAWALNAIERVRSGQPNEDARVELKAEWPDATRAARRIAGHANAARGAPILWLIGVDEKRGVVGAPHADLAKWWPAVKSQFDGIVPHLIDLNVSYKSQTIAALYFETTRAPFVVKSPTPGPIQYEVPWRDGTAVRSADRSELLQILSPLQQLPAVEVMSAELKVNRPTSSALSWGLLMRLYISPHTEQRIVIPFHRCTGTIEVPGAVPPVEIDDIIIEPPREASEEQRRPLSLSIEATNNEVLINGPGKIMLQAKAAGGATIASMACPALVVVELRIADSAQTVTITQALEYQIPGDDKLADRAWRWIYSIPRYKRLVER